MTSCKPSRWIAAASLALAAGTASAHTGDHAVAGFASGFAHPFAGLDHLLAMLAIGLWAAQQGGRAVWAVPSAFIAAMTLGGVLVWTGGALPQVETGIAVSVLALGLLIATRRQWTVPVALSIAAGFALFHGYAHAQEMPQAASPALYALGFALATAALHALGIVGGRVGHRTVQWAGAAMAATGVALMMAG
ncbi:MAG: HupE/UreJ family protein [Pseudomonadota bacterium]